MQNNYRIPREMKADIKLWFIYLSDIPFIVGMLIFTMFTAPFLAESGTTLRFAYYIFNIFFTIIFISKPVPQKSVFNLMVQSIRQDLKKYRSVDYQKYHTKKEVE